LLFSSSSSSIQNSPHLQASTLCPPPCALARAPKRPYVFGNELLIGPSPSVSDPLIPSSLSSMRSRSARIRQTCVLPAHIIGYPKPAYLCITAFFRTFSYIWPRRSMIRATRSSFHSLTSSPKLHVLVAINSLDRFSPSNDYPVVLRTRLRASDSHVSFS
jgi:hypothetical protein